METNVTEIWRGEEIEETRGFISYKSSNERNWDRGTVLEAEGVFS